MLLLLVAVVGSSSLPLVACPLSRTLRRSSFNLKSSPFNASTNPLLGCSLSPRSQRMTTESEWSYVKLWVCIKWAWIMAATRERPAKQWTSTLLPLAFNDSLMKAEHLAKS